MLTTPHGRVASRSAKGRKQTPAGQPDGARKTSHTFELFAPYNKAASVKGSFSDWAEIPMIRHKDGTFRCQVDLADGVYEYKFRVQSRSWFFAPDQWVEVADPRSTAISSADQNSLLRIDQGHRVVDTYVWQHDACRLPSDRDLVIYELHVGDFSGGEPDRFVRGQYSDVVDKLDYLADLGINAVELMPVKENIGGKHSWGYTPRHFFAADSTYGPSEELKRLIDECHARGIRVILDCVYNHADTDSPLAHIDHDYWFHHQPKDAENSWGPEFNYRAYDKKLKINPAAKFISDVAQFWIQEYHIDGFRYDAARQIDNYDFLRTIVQKSKQWASMKPFYNVAEYVPQDASVTGPDGPMDGAWHDSFKHCVADHLCHQDIFDIEALKGALDARREGFVSADSVVNYLSNHDHNHLVADLMADGLDEDAAVFRARMGAALLMTAFGLPMVWMGEEFGEVRDKTQHQSKIDWSLLARTPHQALRETYRSLIALRHEQAALRSDNLDFFHEDAERHVIGYVRWDDEGGHVVVVANFSNADLEDYALPGFPPGNWKEWMKEREVTADENGCSLSLRAGEAIVMLRQ